MSRSTIKTSILQSATKYLVSLTILLGIVGSCQNNKKPKVENTPILELKDLKIQDRVFYNIFIRSFFDSNGDGIGDLDGVTLKLDYLKRLGINGLWLSPFHPSDSYHKYDVKSYTQIDPEYGTLEDFKNLIAEAHERDMVVMMDLVINHTDDNHKWFQKALAGDDYYRQFYSWKTKEQITEKEEHWHTQPPDGGVNNSEELFYGFFWKGMPDLNYDYEPVRDEVKKIAKYWIEFGVDGFRLDAALHIYPFYSEEGDQNMWKSISWWQEFTTYVKGLKSNAFLIGEVWESDAIASEFSKNTLNNFNFSLSGKVLEILKTEKDNGKVAQWLANYRDEIKAVRPDYVDATFLTNHDQVRIASELKGDTAKLKLAASILMTLPGTPFLYYGEEIGMKGIKPDEQIREPMIWYEPGTVINGQTTWQKIIHNLPSKTKSAAAQWKDANSLLNHYKELIFIRKTQSALTNGAFSWLSFENQPKPLFGYMRKLENKIFFIFHNLSKKPINFDWIPVEENGVVYSHKSQFENQEKKSKITIQPYGSLVLTALDAD